jgi:hypothetical protein
LLLLVDFTMLFCAYKEFLCKENDKNIG